MSYHFCNITNVGIIFDTYKVLIIYFSMSKIYFFVWLYRKIKKLCSVQITWASVAHKKLFGGHFLCLYVTKDI